MPYVGVLNPFLDDYNQLTLSLALSVSPTRMLVSHSGSGIIAALGNLAQTVLYGKLIDLHLRLRCTIHQYDSESLIQTLLTGA